jgi:hypothetical protein
VLTKFLVAVILTVGVLGLPVKLQCQERDGNAAVLQPLDGEKLNGIRDHEHGFFECMLFTAGKTYPVAYHVRCQGGTEFGYGTWWHNDVLGITSRDEVESAAKQVLDELVADFAIFILEAKGKM